jgi:hypothetical protein
MTTGTMLNTYLQAKQQQSAALAMHYTVFTPRLFNHDQYQK